MVMHFHHHREPVETSVNETQGSFLSGWHYDFMAGLLMRGREKTFRKRIADLAELHAGDCVLDVGCGTGTLALIVKQRVGETGEVSGIDPSSQMIAHARHKAKRAKLSVNFQVEGIEQLTFPDQSFDIVLSTLMMHHLPDTLKQQGMAEIVRVLKPGGRLLILDMKDHAGSIRDQSAFVKEAGFSQIETEETSFSVFRELSITRARKS